MLQLLKRQPIPISAFLRCPPVAGSASHQLPPFTEFSRSLFSSQAISLT